MNQNHPNETEHFYDWAEEEEKFETRIRESVKKAGGVEVVAAKTDKSVRQIQRYMAGEGMPLDFALALCDAAGVSLIWLITGEHPEPEPSGLVSLPVMNVSASAGGGALVWEPEQAVGHMAFDPAWLQSAYNLAPSDLYVLPCVGDSMEPTIPAGGCVVCSRAPRHLKVSDGVYVFRMDDMIMVKRIQPLPGQILKVSSDNAAYEPFTVDLNNSPDFTILGRIVIVLKRM